MNLIKRATWGDRLKNAVEALKDKPAGSITFGLDIKRCDECEHRRPCSPWHPFPAERPADGALVWVHVPSAQLYWKRYGYAKYKGGTFWRGAEEVTNVTAWAAVEEVGLRAGE